jgi:hypothetical protein
MSVSNCIFNDNTKDAGLPSWPDRYFTFVNCWFSQSIPGGNVATKNSGNVVGVTASYMIDVPEFRPSCALVTPTQSQSPDASRSPAISRTLPEATPFGTPKTDCTRFSGAFITGSSQRKKPSTCVDIRQCLFSKVSSSNENGGAIYMNQEGSATIIDCGFDSCFTGNDYGGAILLSCSNVMIARCCGYRCYAINGQFANIFGSGSTFRMISQSVFIECAPSSYNSASTGAIFVDYSIPVSYSNLNFTKTKGTRGSAIAFTKGPAKMIGSYVSVTECIGNTAIYRGVKKFV